MWIKKRMTYPKCKKENCHIPDDMSLFCEKCDCCVPDDFVHCDICNNCASSLTDKHCDICNECIATDSRSGKCCGCGN